LRILAVPPGIAAVRALPARDHLHVFHLHRRAVAPAGGLVQAVFEANVYRAHQHAFFSLVKPRSSGANNSG
jgi:hypothetical protein